jgi:hypothetical protein
MTIWKYHIEITDRQIISVQAGAEIVHVGPDNDRVPSVWCLVDPEKPKEELTVFIVGTGMPIPNMTKYRGSFTDDPFVWHVFTPTDLRDLIQ